MKILGIDPGLRNTGWGVIHLESDKLKYVNDGVISTKRNLNDGERLLYIFQKLEDIILKFKPNIIGIEKTFVGEGNISSLKLGMARGVCLLVAAKTNISIRELAPKLVKKSVTGTGNADKQQVNSMIKILLGKKPVNDDSSDALAIAITANNHEAYEENSGNSSKYNLNRAIQKALQNQRWFSYTMIASLTGKLKMKLDSSIIVEVNGIGYNLNVSNKTLTQHHEIGSVVTFYTDLQIKDDKILMYGFLSQKEINIFRVLQSIQGIGPKASLSILSALEVDDIVLGITAGDKSVFLKADGIGSRVATRIVSELQDKINTLNFSEEDIKNHKNVNNLSLEKKSQSEVEDFFNDSISAIVNLGYTRSEAFKAVMNVKRELNKDGNMIDTSVEKIIPLALKNLSG